jgi:hypothetical protein
MRNLLNQEEKIYLDLPLSESFKEGKWRGRGREGYGGGCLLPSKLYVFSIRATMSA